MQNFIKISLRPNIVKRALIIALVVGTLIACINYYDKFLSGNLSGLDIAKIMMTYFVPYGVSTFSSVSAIKEQ